MAFPLVPLQSVPPFAVALFAGGFLVGLGLLGAGALVLWRWRVLSADDANQYRAGLDGPLEIEGSVTPTADADPFTAPVSRAECLVCEIEAQKYQSSQHGGSWHTAESRTTARPFVVDSPVGEIRVEPEGADLILDTETVNELGPKDEATGYTKAFFDAVGIERRSGSIDIGITEVGTGSKYRIHESRVDVGESVYVAGQATTDDPTLCGYGGSDAVVRASTGRSLTDRLFGFPFIIGDGGEGAIRRHFLWRGLALAGGGVVATALVAVLASTAV